MSLLKSIHLFAFSLLLAASASYGAETLTPAQQEVRQFIQNMYSYDPATFRYGDFSRKDGKPFLRNHVPENAGKRDIQKQCDLLREFFRAEVIKERTVRSDLTECSADYRYPNLADEDASPDTRHITIPAPRIEAPVVSGARAKVSVLTAGEGISLGRSLYFLTKTDAGWRVSNVMVHTKWPDLDDGTHNCYYSFARKPSDEERKEVPPHCRK